jgi:recombination protein RecT
MSTQLAAKGDLKSLINSDAIRAQIARALPKHMTPDRFLRVATTTLLRVPKLAQCSQESFMKAMLDCSSLGLEPDGRRCHLIPYGTDVQLIVDWKGLVELAKRSGEVLSWKAETVKEKDKFGWVNGVIHHEVNWREDRGKLEAVYSIVKLEGGEVDTEVMTISEVSAIRDRSSGYIYAKKNGKDNPWLTDFEEMAKKTVIRRHSKRLTLSPEFHTALEIDADKIDTNRDRAQAEADRISFDGPAMIAESVEVEGSSDE